MAAVVVTGVALGAFAETGGLDAAPDPNGALSTGDGAPAVAVDPNNPFEPAPVADATSDEPALDPNAPTVAEAAEVESVAGAPVPAPEAAASVMDMAAVIALVQQQQAQLAEQQETLEKQSRQLEVLREELDALRAPPITEEPKEEVGLVVEESEPIDIKMEGDQVAEAEPVEKTNTEKRQ
jgi:uncharacterized coiled-coil protein SlyX